MNLAVTCAPAAPGSVRLVVTWNAPDASPIPIESYQYNIGGVQGSVPAVKPIPQIQGNFSVSKTVPRSNDLVQVSSQGASQRSDWVQTRADCSGV